MATNLDENKWAMFAHLAAFAGFLFPLGNIIGPLIVWLFKKDEFARVEDQGKESLNFQISISIYMLASFVLAFSSSIFETLPFFSISFLVIFALFIIDGILIIKATIVANSGQNYRYPLTLRFIK